MGKTRARAGLVVLGLLASTWSLQAQAFFCFSFGMGSGPRLAPPPPPPVYAMPPGPLPFAPPPVTSYTAPAGPPGSGVAISAPLSPKGSRVRAAPSVWEGLQDQDTSDRGATF